MPRAAHLNERVQTSGGQMAEQVIPELRTQPHRAAQLSHRMPKTGRAPESSDVRQQLAEPVISASVNRQHEEHGRLGGRAQNGLLHNGSLLGVSRNLSCLNPPALARGLDTRDWLGAITSR